MLAGHALRLSVALSSLAAPVWGQTGPYRWARVTAAGPGSASIDAGSSEGLRTFTRVEIVRRGHAVAILKVVTLAAHQTTCEITSRPIPLLVGDSARFLPSGRPNEAVAVAPRPAPPVPGPPPASVVDSAPRVQPKPPGLAPSVAPAPLPPSNRIVTPAPGHLADSALVRAIPVAPAPAPRDTTPVRVVPKPARSVAPPVAPAPAPRDTTPVRVVPKPAATPPVPPPVPTPPAARAPAPPAAAAPAPAQTQSGPLRSARVTFVTTSSAYVNAGKAEGLAVDGRVDVVRRGRSVAELKVTFLSTHQAACQIISVVDSVVVGDSVRYAPIATTSDSAAVARAPRAAPRPVSQSYTRPSRTGRLRGRVGLYFLSVQSAAGRVSQPSGDFRLNGAGLGGSSLGLAIDVRSRRVVQSFTGSPTSTRDLTRVYQASLFWQSPGSPFRFTTGRQYAPGISSVGLLDGASAEVSLAVWDYGLFAGTQPDPANFGFSSQVAQLGGYLRLHNRPASLTHWSYTVGASGAYLEGQTNREFAYFQANYLTRRFSVYAVQEVDYYRPWRRAGGEKAISPTSTFANLQVQVVNGFSLTSGFDNRRSVRLGNEFADSVFDDTFRRGVWAGFAARFARHFQASFDARTNHDSSTGTANTLTLALGADRLTPLGVSLRTRSTRYTTPARQGWLNSVALGVEPFGRGSLQLTSGWRSEQGATPTSIHWLAADMDASLLRSLFVIVSAYRERGGIEGHDLLYAGVSFRF